MSELDSTGRICKAPYFTPFGDPKERASIPDEYVVFFSNGCLLRSMFLWNQIESLTGKEIYIKNLPERIINTKGNDRIVNILRRGLMYDEKNPDRNNGFCR